MDAEASDGVLWEGGACLGRQQRGTGEGGDLRSYAGRVHGLRLAQLACMRETHEP